MSLLQKASIITTPTAYAEDYLYSIKPAYALGSELVTNGTFDTDSDWTKGTGWTISSGKAVGSSASGTLQQDIGAVVSKKYKVTFEVTSYTGGTLYVDLGGASAQTTTSAGLKEFTFKATSTNNLRFYGGSITCSIDNVSVKEITDADFDFDRNSTGTRVNEDYLIEDVPYNLLSYTEDFTQWSNARTTDTANQIISPDGLNNGTLLEQQSGQTNAGSIYKAINTSGTYTLSVFAKKKDKNFIVLYDANAVRTYFNLNTGQIGTIGGSNTASISSAGNGWYRCSTTFTVSSGTVIAFYVGDNDNSSTVTDSGGVYIWGAQVVKGDQPKEYLKTTDRLDIPRIDYTNGEPSILLEPSRTNSFNYSQDFSDTYWDKVGVTIGSNVTTSPEGITNASKIKETSESGYHNINWDGNVTSGTTYTVSVFFKADDRTTASLYENVGSGSLQLSAFNLETGKVDTENPNHTALMLSYPNGWYRCSITFTPNASRSGSIYIAPNNTLTYTGVTDSGVFVYGAQLETGSYATSLIHTSGSAVTRSADRADNAGNSDLINSTEGVFYLQFAALTGAGSFDDLSLSDGTQNNKVQLFYRATDKINARVTVGGVNVFDHIYQSTDMTQFEKVAIKWKLNDFSMYVDGREVDSDSSGATFSANTLNVIKINDNNISDYVGKIKCLAVFKEALTDLELEKLTGYNNHELYMNYYNRLSYLGLVEEYNVESDINNYIL
jgi:hypothetical protein